MSTCELEVAKRPEKRGHEASYEAISPADFFYRNKSVAGFDNPARALYTAIREILENSVDACEEGGVTPEIKLSLADEGDGIYHLRIEDNGIGIPKHEIAKCFGTAFYGSKYVHKQGRGRFGLGGTMAILYGQATTHRSFTVTSSTGNDRATTLSMRINIEKNTPQIISNHDGETPKRWRGTVLEFSLEGDWVRAKSKVLDYMRQSAVIAPYARLEFRDPDEHLHLFERVTQKMPPPPKEVLPHPRGVDAEMLTRLIGKTDANNMASFLSKHFHRVGKKTAERFLGFARVEAGLNPKSLPYDELVRMARCMKEFEGFLPPDARCLSPLGPDLMEAGIKRVLNPEYVAVNERPPSSYSGHPFIVECGAAYGGSVPKTDGFLLYRYANRIPLLYDAYSDVSFKVVQSVNWSRYKLRPTMPVAFFIHVVSTKIPFKTLGKEYIAAIPEIEHEIKLGLMECGRMLARYLRRKERIERQDRRMDHYRRYLPLILRDITELGGYKRKPALIPLLEKVAEA